ncbi:LytTR family DNA-binding domain-containing protein [Janthinobacterium sp. SUN118]|uniref:LytR/AlgR family response regulator transcription factor n=1 Tax=Janthinobacterium sp. SUN118 TaxID=3004100 RepID=UPI0025AF9667|nr:LytTR family DNA-binding domain-containing protein [Janthinobacterium sp. SUN118]MDN2710815.1 LytTR family DNA-binding domain-containing protein [Janthinobacterium sp. SUN118]
MNATILIAEDEPLMRERLQAMLALAWPEARIVLVAENGNDAWDGFLEHEPQVVFLDIRMPGLSGLEVAERIGTRAHVVFVTAYDQYAVDAFDAGAVDYLLKPVQGERLARALSRLRGKLDAQPADMASLLHSLRAALPAPPREKLKWIKASVGKQIRLIDVNDVLFFQADTKYTRVVLAGAEALVRTPLKDLLGGLDPEQFWQIHRGTMVNVSAIAAAERIDAERMQVLLRGSTEKLPVSRTFTYLFRD